MGDWSGLVEKPTTDTRFHTGDHSGVNTGITQFRGRSEILAGKFCRNSTGIHRNDRNRGGTDKTSLGYAPSFSGEISHDQTIIAPSFSFLNVVKSCDLVLFSWRKMQKKTKKKRQWWEKCFTSYLHNGTTLEYNSNRLGKLQLRTTIVISLPFCNRYRGSYPFSVCLLSIT